MKAGGNRTTTTYDAAGNVSTVRDANGFVTSYAYDADDRQTVVTTPAGAVTTMYDAVGDVTATVDALSNTTTSVYDVLHRQIATITPLGGPTTTVLDANGAAAASIDGAGDLSVNMINALGQNVGSVDPLGNVTQTLTDPTGAPRAVIDSVGNETDYVLNSVGETTVTKSPTGATTMLYDTAQRVTSETDADGRVIQYSYNKADELIGEVWKNSSGVTVNVQTFTYDNDGNLQTAMDVNGTVTYTYNGNDQVASYTDVFGQTLTYSYNANNQVTQRADSLGGTLTYVYDTTNRLTSEQFSGTGATGTVVRVDFGYNARSDQTTITWYSNLAGTAVVAKSVYSFDSSDRISSIANGNGSGTALSAYTYGYDAASRVNQQQHSSTVGTTVYAGTNSYTYNAASELVYDGTQTYSYDANGNRTMTGYATGSNNELTSDGTWNYSYDPAGNQTVKSNASDTWTYTYDNMNHLTGAIEKSSGGTLLAQETFTYDVQGKLVQQAEYTSTSGTTTTTRFAVDAWGTTWAQLDGSNNLQVRLLTEMGTNQLLTRTVASGANAGVSIYETDNQGSVRDIVSWSGAVTDHIDYSGYGVITTESNSSVGDQHKYGVYQYFAALGLYDAKARWYNPATGNWQSLDPILFGGGQPDLYEYVGNDPTNATDPTGLVNPRATSPQVQVIPGDVKILPTGYGGFNWASTFKLSKKSHAKYGGLIIQRVQREVLLFDKLGRYIRTDKKSSLDYFQVWRVLPEETTPNTRGMVTAEGGDYEKTIKDAGFGQQSVDDFFGSKSKPTKDAANFLGKVVIKGTVYYFDGLDKYSEGFRAKNRKTTSGFIPSIAYSGKENQTMVKTFFQENEERITSVAVHLAIATWHANGDTKVATYPYKRMTIPQK